MFYMKKNKLSKRTKELPNLVIGKLLKIASEDKSIVSLGPGEPDFVAPSFAINAAKKSLTEGKTHYCPPSGLPKLKQAIIKKLKKENKITAKENEIVVTNGSQEALFLATAAICDPKDKVLVPNPGFLAYIPMSKMLNITPVPVKATHEDNFALTYEKLNKAYSKNTKFLMFNSPANPTGKVYSKKELEEIADFIVEKDIMIFSDEAYEHFTYDKHKHHSMASLNGMKPYTLTLQTCSKSYAMAGFRLGYAHGPDWLIDAMTKTHIFTTITASTASQYAGIAALTLSKQRSSVIEKMKKSYDKRRNLVYKRIDEIPEFQMHKPEGAFYAFPKFTMKKTSFNLAKDLLEKGKVATIPGTEFGKYGEGYLRLSYATNYNLIEKAFDRIEKYLKKK